jgi:CPA2 family monovalent cation:H+ antiporter-2
VAVASGIPGSLAALATGYVLITIIVGPILARVPDSRGFSRWTRRIQADRRARSAT